MVSPEQMRDFEKSLGWNYVEQRMKEWRDSYIRDLLNETDIYEIVRIQARLQQLEAMLRIPKAFAEDLECEALHKNHKNHKEGN